MLFLRYILLTLGFVVFISSNMVGETFRPLRTEGTQTLEAKAAEVGIAIVYRNNVAFPFTKDSDQPNRDEWEVPRLYLNAGLSDRVEFQVDYAYLSIDEDSPGAGKETGSGDARAFTKFRFIDEQGWRPDLAARVGMKLPNADDEKRLGTDETDLFFELLAGKRYGRLDAAVNLGLGILGEPGRAEQDDVLTYGVAGVFKLTGWVDLAAEVNGMAFSRKDNDASSFLGAVRCHWKVFTFYAGASAGLQPRSEDYGIVAGFHLTHQF